MLLLANTLLPVSGPPVRNAAVRVLKNRIVESGASEAIRPAPGEEVVDLGEVVLLPGLINAHCHLEYSCLKKTISPPKSFPEWIKRLNSIKRQLAPDDILESIRRGFREASQFGTTTVCSMMAFPELMGNLPPPPIRTWWFYEMIDVRHRITSTDMVAGALSFFEKNSDPLTSHGLNPHAPYTASVELYRLASDCALQRGMIPTTHVAESAEEMSMFRDAQGPLFEFLESIGRPTVDCGQSTPFSLLWKTNSIGPDWILTHMNELEPADFEILEALPQLPHVVHCPGSHHYFGHRPFPFTKLAALGANICIGTDSLASTDSLSLLGELRRFQKSHPQLSAESLLEMVTLAPAKALQHTSQLGCIQPGAFADLIAIPFEGTPLHAAQAVIDHVFAIRWMMVDGKIVPLESD